MRPPVNNTFNNEYKSYTNWAAGEPTEEWDGEAEDCVRVYNTGMWNDAKCADTYPFVCKLPRPTVSVKGCNHQIKKKNETLV